MTELPHTMDLTQIGHYAIIRHLGRGGMGLVYLARDTRLDRQVAIKCLRTELFEPHYRERFKREALLLAKLNHPHIVQIYDYQETPDQLALVMEYVEGQNLHQHLREHIVPLTQRMQWLVQIAQGLAVAHDAGIIHRDLKAENILINKHKLAKITDLGIAKSQDFNATLTDHVTGSYGSMSPEQAMGEELDNRSDLFSFGILAYQLLCGVHPFGDTQNKLQLMQRIISHPPIPPTKTNPDLPPEVIELLGQLLSKNPDNRPANTHWVAAQCEKLYQLISLKSGSDLNTTEMLSHAQTSHSGIRNSRHSKEHPTFETRFKKNKSNLAQDLAAYARDNSISVALIGIALAMVIGAVIWQLQPKQPKYIAVLPPNLNATGMQDSQQELVKGAVYDAIQQSVLQLDGYYLIPQTEINDLNAANSKEGIEAVRRATAADELITTEIQCKIEACTIKLSRLTPESEKQESRLKVQDTKTVDVLTDNYLSVATIIQVNLEGLYSKEAGNIFEKFDEKEYTTFLAVNRLYRDKGAKDELLEDLDAINVNAKKLPAVQTLYTEIALDMHYETENDSYLKGLEKFLSLQDSTQKNISVLRNKFLMEIAQKKYGNADTTLEEIRSLKTSDSQINDLKAYLMMAKKDYVKASEHYKKSLNVKKTANGLYYLSLAQWYLGDNDQAKTTLEESLKISPNLYKSYNLIGLIYLVTGNIDSAMQAFEKSIANKPTDSITLNNLGLCYLLLKKYPQALDTFSRANDIAPNISSQMLNQADTYELLENNAEATIWYTKLINFLTKKELNNENLIHLAQAHAHLGNFSEALKYLQKLEKEDSQNYRTAYTAALVHTLAKNNTSAILNIESSLNLGMNKIWFSFPWFDRLCVELNFVELMKKIGEPNRCSPTLNKKP